MIILEATKQPIRKLYHQVFQTYLEEVPLPACLHATGLGQRLDTCFPSAWKARSRFRHFSKNVLGLLRVPPTW